MKFPSKPSRGQRALQAIYNTVCQIIDYLPSLEVRGDNTTTSVTHSSAGTIIHAKQNLNKPKQQNVQGSGGEYLADNISLSLNGQVFSIKPPSDQSKNYALCWINGTYVWAELEDC